MFLMRFKEHTPVKKYTISHLLLEEAVQEGGDDPKKIVTRISDTTEYF